MKDYTVRILNVALEVYEYTIEASSEKEALRKGLAKYNYFETGYRPDIKKIQVTDSDGVEY